MESEDRGRVMFGIEAVSVLWKQSMLYAMA